MSNTETNTTGQSADSDDATISDFRKSDAGKLEKGYEEQSRVVEKVEKRMVTLEAEDDPKQIPLIRKWLAVLAICTAATCVTCTSSIAAAAEAGESRELHASKEVTILGISLFVEGLGCGPLLLGPLSEFYGRNPVYRISYTLFWIFSWPVAFAPNIACYLAFRFISGFSGAAFLSVAGGSVSDLFSNDKVATPMAVYTISPFIGPVLGPLISGFINQNLDWRWTYRFQLIWSFVQLLALFLLVPETYVPIILKRKAQRIRKHQHKTNEYAPIETQHRGIFNAILVSCYKPFQLLLFDRMVLLLDLWFAINGLFVSKFRAKLTRRNAVILGILYLAFQAFPIIFQQGHGFNQQMTGMSFLGIGLGMVLGLASQGYWNNVYRRQSARYDGRPPPEVRLLIAMPGGILVSLSLFWLAFTTYPHVHWIVPIIASIPFGTGIAYVFTGSFTYLVTAYRPIAASAMASNSALRSAFAAVFPLFAGQMYSRLGTVGATALLAGITTVMAPLPFIFYKFGARLRASSKFAEA